MRLAVSLSVIAVVSVAVCVAVLTLADQSVAVTEPIDGGGPLNIGYYSHTNGGCASRVNPIGAVFYNYGGLDPTDGGYTLSHLQYNVGWGQTYINVAQYFADAGVCTSNDGDVADDWVINSRNHMRLENITDHSLGSTSVGTPHYEIAECGGHAVTRTINGWSGFDEARRALYDKLSDHHYTTYQYWGNTNKFKQCNGYDAQSNGNVRFFSVPNYAYP